MIERDSHVFTFVRKFKKKNIKPWICLLLQIQVLNKFVLLRKQGIGFEQNQIRTNGNWPAVYICKDPTKKKYKYIYIYMDKEYVLIQFQYFIIKALIYVPVGGRLQNGQVHVCYQRPKLAYLSLFEILNIWTTKYMWNKEKVQIGQCVIACVDMELGEFKSTHLIN